MTPQKVAQYGVTIALVAAMTSIAIPIPATRGYFNLGEAVIFFAAFMYGGRLAAICGAIGAAIIDLIYAPQFVPATIVAKGLEGFVAGAIAFTLREHSRQPIIRTIAFLSGGALMILTYFLYEWLVLPVGFPGDGGLAIAVAELPWNFAQILIGGTTAILLAEGIVRAYPNVLRNRD